MVDYLSLKARQTVLYLTEDSVFEFLLVLGLMFIFICLTGGSYLNMAISGFVYTCMSMFLNRWTWKIPTESSQPSLGVRHAAECKNRHHYEVVSFYGSLWRRCDRCGFTLPLLEED